MHTPKSERQGFGSITEIVSKFQCHAIEEDTTDVERIYRATQQAIGLIRKTEKPCFLRIPYYRYLEHVGVYEDFDAGYRPRKEFEVWQKRDPVHAQRKKLLNSGMKEITLANIEKRIDEKIKQSVKKAKKAPFALEEEVYNDVFCEYENI